MGSTGVLHRALCRALRGECRKEAKMGAGEGPRRVERRGKWGVGRRGGGAGWAPVGWRAAEPCVCASSRGVSMPSALAFKRQAPAATAAMQKDTRPLMSRARRALAGAADLP